MYELEGLDFETYSEVNIKTHGLDRYVNHPSFTPLCAGTWGTARHSYDFVLDEDSAPAFLDRLESKASGNSGYLIAAQNSPFEKEVLKKMGASPRLLERLVDSAVVSRIMGASSRLEFAAPQLTSINKLETGKQLIPKFCMPNDWNGGAPPTAELLLGDRDALKLWQDFQEYCLTDAFASYGITAKYLSHPGVVKERELEKLTQSMNEHGWQVDMELLREMQLRYDANVQQALADFRELYDVDGELNFASPLQLKDWAAARGVRAASFDQDHVVKLLGKVRAKLATLALDDPKYTQYMQVAAMLRTKQIIGGSSLKKLKTIENLVGYDGRLRHQYMHCGAGQSYRTSGRGAQMQNLKRLQEDVLDMDDVYDTSLVIDNDTLGANLRQVFTASDPNGYLIVGDLSSVESRGLAYLAGADWKLEEYRRGRDMYKVLASKFYGVEYDEVTKPQRQGGKVGELSCGYGAGPGAVCSFAEDMGIEMSEAQSLEIVTNWRTTNPEVEQLWEKLDSGLHAAVSTGQVQHVPLAHKLHLVFAPTITPDSLLAQHPGAQTIEMVLRHEDAHGEHILTRTFQGCYKRGRNVCYYKPDETVAGPAWKSHYRDPKTGVTKFFNLYGGKLAGILTQSFCRELFFDCMQELDRALRRVPNATLIGQFHDELIVDWVPGTYSRNVVEKVMENAMTWKDPLFHAFPLAADIKKGYRYIK